MTEPQQQVGNQVPHSVDLSSFHGVLAALVGQILTVSNTESYEDVPMGHRIAPAVYKAKLTSVKTDYLTLVTDFKHASGEIHHESAKQFIPLSRVKRVSVMKSEKIIHL